MRARRIWILVVGMIIVSCGSGPSGSSLSSQPASTSPPDGREVFERTVLGDKPGCVTCHSFTPDVVLVGPSLAGLVRRAEAETPGEPREYIRESIAVPDAMVQPGFSTSMPVPSITDEEVSALVDYLMEAGS